MARQGNVPQIHIGGKKRPIKFGTNATAIYCKLHGISLNDYNEKVAKKFENGNLGLDELRDLIYSALAAASYSKGEEPDFNNWTVGDWLDEVTSEQMEKISQALVDSMPQGNEGANGKKKPVKKAQ